MAPTSRKYFLDTEFVEHGDTVIPVSIGLVSESGREYYAEYATDWERHASAWVKEHVRPHLEGNTKPREAIRDELLAFVGDLPCEFWAYFAATDWVVVIHTLGGLSLFPKNWRPFIMDLAWLDPGLERIRALPIHNPKPHHALWDARELRTRYFGLVGAGPSR